MIYVGDSESQSRDAAAYAYNPGCEKGIRFGRINHAHDHALGSGPLSPVRSRSIIPLNPGTIEGFVPDNRSGGCRGGLAVV
jgi:hypothetical protein